MNAVLGTRKGSVFLVFKCVLAERDQKHLQSVQPALTLKTEHLVYLTTAKLARKSVRARRKNPKKFQDHMERIAFKGGKARWQKKSGPSIIANYILRRLN